MKEDKQIDELFHSKLGDVEIKPPAYVWDGIVEKQTAVRRKKRALWFRVSAVAALLLVAFLLGKVLQQEQPAITESQSIAEQTQTSPEKEAIVESESQASILQVEPEESSTTKVSGDVDEMEGLAHAETPSSSEAQAVLTGKKESLTAADKETDGSESARSFFTMLQKRLETLDFFGPKSDELDQMGNPEEGSFLKEADRLIVQQNQQALLVRKEKDAELNWSVGARVNPVLAMNESKHSQQYALNMNQSTGSRNMQLGGGLTVAVETKGRWSFQSGVMYNGLGQSSSNDVSGRSSMLDLASIPAFSDGPVANQEYFKAGESSGGLVVIQAPAGKIVLNSLPQNAVVAADLETVAASSSNDVLMISSEFEQVFDYIEIPFLVRYQLLDQKFGIQLMAGVNTGFLVGNSAYLDNGGGRTNIGKTSDMNSVSYSSNFGLGLGYKLSPTLQLRFEPQIRYFLESLSSNPDVTYKPYTFGFYTGISYSF